MFKSLFVKIILLAVTTAFLGCVNTGDSNAAPASLTVTYPYPALRISPSIQYLIPNQVARLYPEGGSGTYTFTMNSGLSTVDASGNFTAASLAGTNVVKVSDNAGGQGFGTVIVLNPLALTPAGDFVTTTQKKQFVATGGLPPYTYSILDVGKGTINSTTGLLTAPATVGVTLVQVKDSLGNQTQVNVRFLDPLIVFPSVGFFPSNQPLNLVRSGGEGQLTYTFQQGAGLVTVDPVTNIITPNPGVTGRVQFKITDTVGYQTVITLDFFNPRRVAIGKSHTCAVNTDSQLYCWGGNDRGQTGDTQYGPIIGDDPTEMGDALLGITNFTGVNSISIQGNSTCIIHTTSGNREIKCWGAGDSDYSFGLPSYYWLGNWMEQNQPYGSGSFEGLYTRNYSDYWDGQGVPFGANGRHWSVRSNVGDTLAHPLSISSSFRIQSDIIGGTNFLDKLIGIDKNGVSHNMCYTTTDNKVTCIGEDSEFGPSSGDSTYATGSTSLLGYVTYGVADGSAGQIISKMGAVLKFSNASAPLGQGGNVSCFVILLNNSTLKTMPTNYASLYANKKRIVCLNGYGGYNQNNVAALENGGSYNNWILSIPRSTGTAGLASYFSAGFPHPEIANIFATSNANSGAELDALDVAVTRFTGCGLFDGGAGARIVKCWGSNQFGMLGIGTLVPTEITAPPYNTVSFPVNETVTNLYSNGDQTFCAKTLNSVSGNYNLFCWGKNDQGQIARVASPQYSAPTQVDLSMFQSSGYVLQEVQGSSGTFCARLSHATNPNQLVCWGSNTWGLLGVGADPLVLPYSPTAQPVILSSAQPFSVKTFSMGENHACAVSITDVIKCWGGRQFGQLGAYRTFIQGDEPQEVGAGLNKVPLSPLRTVKDVFAGYKSTCGILSGNNDGELFCFGANGDRQLGRSDSPPFLDVGSHDQQVVDTTFTLNRATLNAQAGFNSKVVKVAGTFGMFALTDTGKLFSWGSNYAGMLGYGNASGDSSSPTLLTNIGPVKDITSSRAIINAYSNAFIPNHAFACLVLANPTGDVHCWGTNYSQTLGRIGAGFGNAVNTTVTPGNTFVNLGNFKTATITSGTGHVCALSDLGKVKCWGDNSVGQLGIGVTNNNGSAGNGPVPLNSSSEMGDNLRAIDLGTDVAAVPYTVKQIVSGDRHNCALFTDGRAKCWGDNTWGQLGLGTTNTVGAINGQMGNNLAFADVGPGTTILRLSAGGNTTCAVLSNNDVKCWGDNSVAQLGTGDKLKRGTTALNSGTNLQKVLFPP